MSIKYRSNYDWLEKRMTPVLTSSEPAGTSSVANDLGMTIQNNEDLKLIEDDDLKYLAGNEAKLFVPGGAFNKKEIKSTKTHQI